MIVKEQSLRLSPAQLLSLFCAIILILLFAMHYRLGMEMADDGAFFLRYAENMLKGQFWVWNLGDPPIWGASAPLYPLLVALPMALGVSPVAAIIGVGLCLASVSLTAVTLMLGHRFGVIAGIAFLIFSTLDTGMMYFSGAGLETSLTIGILTFALWTLLYKPDAWWVGVVAGLLMVNKLDLVPVGGLLLLAHWIRDKRFPKVAFVVAVVIAALWYGFAWLYFGAPVPNSFITKSLHQNNLPKIINWTWFGSFLFLAGIHKWLAGFTIIAVERYRRDLLPIWIFLLGMVLIHLTAYTIKYPFEPYNWYVMPSVFALMVCGAIGLASLVNVTANWCHGFRAVSGLTGGFILGLIIVTNIGPEKLGTENIKSFASHQEYDRSEAGRWVAAHTPKNFVVYTMWGNPAYYSQRRVLDGSFLNHRYDRFDLISKYRPQVLILQNNPGTNPMKPVFARDVDKAYSVVKVFDKSYIDGMDYFFVVLVRNDVLGQVTDIDPPRDLLTYISSVKLGDVYGILKPMGEDTLFVHPGATTKTEFEFDDASYLDKYQSKSDGRDLTINARISPAISEAAIKRGGGNVRVWIKQGGKILVTGVVTAGRPMVRTFSIAGREPLHFIVGNNGNPDTDWLLVSIH